MLQFYRIYWFILSTLIFLSVVLNLLLLPSSSIFILDIILYYLWMLFLVPSICHCPMSLLPLKPCNTFMITVVVSSLVPKYLSLPLPHPCPSPDFNLFLSWIRVISFCFLECLVIFRWMFNLVMSGIYYFLKNVCVCPDIEFFGISFITSGTVFVFYQKGSEKALLQGSVIRTVACGRSGGSIEGMPEELPKCFLFWLSSARTAPRHVWALTHLAWLRGDAACAFRPRATQGRLRRPVLQLCTASSFRHSELPPSNSEKPLWGLWIPFQVSVPRKCLKAGSSSPFDNCYFIDFSSISSFSQHGIICPPLFPLCHMFRSRKS